MESSNTESQVKDSDHNLPRKQKRRTRNDPNNRNFACGCGKAYLSYPALYTHLKQKHDGKAPEGTNLPQSNNKGIRGRPKNAYKKEENVQLQEKEEDDEECENSDSSYEEESSLNEFLYYLANLSKNLPGKNDKPAVLVMENESDNANVIETFPQDYFEEKQDFLGILIYLKEIVSNNGNIFEESNEETQLKKTICDRVFAIFLYKIARHVTTECFQELCVFICLFRKTMNIKGWEVKKLLEGNINAPKMDNSDSNLLPFCETNTPEFALEISNDFIVDYFPRFFKELKCNNDMMMVLGLDDEKLKNVVYLTQHFCNWLFSNYYTNSRLSLNLN